MEGAEGERNRSEIIPLRYAELCPLFDSSKN